jgi:hypothetical protein
LFEARLEYEGPKAQEEAVDFASRLLDPVTLIYCTAIVGLDRSIAGGIEKVESRGLWVRGRPGPQRGSRR